MKTTSKLLLVLSFCCTGLLGASAISAAVAAEPPSDAPPKVDNLDEGDPAVTNLKKSNTQQTQQTVQNGEQTEVRVTTSVGTYVAKPNQHVGTSLPGDAQSNSNNPVQWIIKSWGGSKNTEPVDDAPPTLQPNPNPEPRNGSATGNTPK